MTHTPPTKADPDSALHEELERYRFIARLDDAIRHLDDPARITHTAASLLGEYLGVDRCAYAHLDDPDHFTLTGNYTNGANGIPSIVGRYEMAAFGREFVHLNRRGLPYIVDDAETDERVRDVLPAYRDAGIRAVVSVPLMKDGTMVAGMALHQARPRHWQEHEVRLLAAVAGRCWESIERGRIAGELDKVQERIRASHDYLRLLINCTAEGFYSVDSEGRTIMCNTAFLTMLGFEREEDAIGRKLHDLIHHSHPDGTHYHVGDCPIYQAAHFGRPAYVQDELFYRVDGTGFPVEYRAQPVWQDGLLQGAVCTFVDISERKRAEEALREADRRKDEFLAMLAHELRNPMAPIRAAADLMEVAQLDADRLKRTSQIISRQVRHMTGLVDDLLDVSRVTRGLVTLEQGAVDVKQVIADALEQIRPLIESKRHHLTVDLDPEPAHVLGDHKRLIQILTNLLNNAAKYTHPGGAIHLSMQVPETTVVLRVADNGVGIEPGLQSHVFDLFAQAERSPDRAQGGLGIGLALVKSLVELHGGGVRCHSEGRGKGSVFLVTLPRLLAEAPAAGTAADGAMPSVPPRRRRILVVDDNADAASMLAMYLEVAGHEVLVEHSSTAALDRATAEPPEICVLDIGLPGIDGHELARRLRSQPATAACLLIAVTGYGQAQDRQRALAAGFDHHLVKPVNAATLLELIAASTR